MAEDYYQILGVERGASQPEIQKAYRKLAQKHHPDVNPDDDSAKEKFQKVQRAYEILGDEDKRRKYDRFGHQAEQTNWEGGFPGGGGGGFNFDMGGGGGGFEDMFSQFFGGGRRAPVKGQDFKSELEISLQTAVMGGEATLNLRRPDGERSTIAVKIRPGAEDGQLLRLSGQGGSSPHGGPAGDLLVTLRIAKHPHFRRQGADLVVSAPLTVAEATLGAKIDAPTPHGEITLTVPPGTPSGKRLRVKGCGGLLANGAKGDLYVEIQIVPPTELSEEEQEWMRQIAKRRSDQPRENLRW